MSRSSYAEPNQLNGDPKRPSKRLILCEDGTWLDSDNASLKGSLNYPSNVTRIQRAIKSVSSDGIPQVVYYHFGVGGGGGFLSKLAGFSGAGINEIIREGYEFLCANYTPGDEIFIFGFSRGAYTARSIAGLINEVGILTKDGLPDLPEIYRDVSNRYNDHYRPKYPDIPFPHKPSARDPAYREGLVRRRLTRLDVTIKVVGVWETVGSLGVPRVPWLQRIGLQSTTIKDYRFHDTSLGDCIENAFQALALDERRYSFQPCLWEKLEGNRTTLRQVWFPGAHSNVGGGYNDQQIATITLAWMIAQCQPFLDFDLDYVLDQWEESEGYEEEHAPETRPWSFGEIFTGITAAYALGGTSIRSPGRYTLIDPENGKSTGEPLINTREFIHPCVRARIQLKGPYFENKGVYDCKSLTDWKLIVENEDSQRRPYVYWRSRSRPPEGFVGELPEAPLKPLEIEILEYDRETCDYVLRPSGVRRRGTRKARSDG
ncbi:hypothetical protein BDY17DRAFT_314772 [Neohortaea acidophila]|uniref:T6SS Phospholipase effector Tle1-like catalytic domain-containing protein n=1 Tax=Neohortaea acidophila TaxID=245834 RepID=A0A6A6Q6H9_9PEZI|nr:uncharacterized protein BDY17DRAFT_314772 [Neohortaea acidophila]KAF2487990.1 hypothetical protein BDY17DRAFT_314772 [Neohortaea acidophila]